MSCYIMSAYPGCTMAAYSASPPGSDGEAGNHGRRSASFPPGDCRHPMFCARCDLDDKPLYVATTTNEKTNTQPCCLKTFMNATNVQRPLSLS